jgi:hypothetical protein
MSELHSNWGNLKAFLHETSNNTSTDYQRVPFWAFRLLTLDISYHLLKGYWGPRSEGDMISFILHGNSDFHYNVLRWFFLALSVGLAGFALAIGAIRAWGKEGRKESHPFFWAGVLGVVVNVALLGATHKDLYGHYVQCLIPFYFVVFAELGQWAETNVRASQFVFITAFLVCIGGVDAAVWASRTMDSRNGLYTMRRVMAAIGADNPNASRVTLGFIDFHSSSFPYDELAAREPGKRVRYGDGNQYEMTLLGHAPPKGGRELMRTGPVVLYRVR